MGPGAKVEAYPNFESSNYQHFATHYNEILIPNFQGTTRLNQATFTQMIIIAMEIKASLSYLSTYITQ